MDPRGTVAGHARGLKGCQLAQTGAIYVNTKGSSRLFGLNVGTLAPPSESKHYTDPRRERQRGA